MRHDFSDAKCIGKWWLFESTDLADHIEARSICAECPLRDACADLLDQERKNPFGDPAGTWAGQLVGVKPKKERPREHGTTKGYYQHKNRREEACEPCKEASRFDAWLRRRYGVSA